MRHSDVTNSRQYHLCPEFEQKTCILCKNVVPVYHTDVKGRCKECLSRIKSKPKIRC